MLFYAVFGELDLSLPLSRSKYRTNGAPAGFDLMSYDRGEHATVFENFCSGFVWEDFQSTNPKLAAAIEAAPNCAVLRGEVDDAPNLNYLRDAVGMMTYLLDCGAQAIYDPQILRWWTPDDWRETIFDPAAAVPRHHATILVSEETDGLWFHSRGMRKFGRPDISVRGVGPAFEEAVENMFNRFIEFLAFGGLPPEGQEIRMRDLPDGGIVRHGGSLDDPDFNNVHFEVVWPGDELKSDE